MPTKKITCVNDLIKHLNKDISAANGPVWFRGHSDENWRLQPHYDRLTTPPPETSLLNRFRQNANLLLTTIIPKNDFDWLFLMQHYGVPTRLLDWSESPLIALYFALDLSNNDTIGKDGALWMLYPYLLNNNANAREKNYIPAFEEEDYLASYTVDKYAKGTDRGILPIAAIATRNNPRIQAQLGVFTISHREKIPIDQIGDKKHIKKYVITAADKIKINDELKLLGINKFQLFPELSVIGEILKGELK